MLTKSTTPRRRHFLLAAGLGVLLSGCTVFRSDPVREARFDTDLAPSTAAWLVAEVCRREFPAVDTLPMHAWAPVVQTEDGYRIHLVRHGNRGFRLSTNGRISPPDAGSPRLASCRFQPNPRPTSYSASADQEVLFAVSGTASGSSVQWSLRGDQAVRVAGRVRQALAAAAAVVEVETLLDGGDPEGAESLARQALEVWPTQGCGTHRRLAARLFLLRAQIALRRGGIATARQMLQRAIHCDLQLAAARTLLTTATRRLAAPGHATDDAPTDLPTSRSATALRIGAAALLERGDLAGAAHWARQAVAQAPDSAQAARLLARAMTGQRPPQLALEEGLLALETFGFDAELVLSTARLHTRLGHPAAGLRLLVRHQGQLFATSPRPTEELVRRLASRLPIPTAVRILERGDAALAIRFSPGLPAGGAFAALAARLEFLRAHHGSGALPASSGVMAGTAQDAYRMAPGVVPGPAR